MLDLPVCAGMSDFCPVYLDIVVVIEVKELLPIELGPVVSDDRVRDPKIEDSVLDKAYHLFGANFGQGPSLDLLSELADRDKQVGGAPGHFFEGSQEVYAPHGKGLHDGDGLEILGQRVDLLHKVLAPYAKPHNLNCVVDGHWPIKTLSEGFTDHAS
jgi:hypothetical protein